MQNNTILYTTVGRKMRMLWAGALLLTVAAIPLSAQMTPEQRLFDFQAVASLYAKRYAPANWKQQSIGVNIFEVKPWADRVRAAKSDIEYFEIMSKYVASFRDGHTGYSAPSRFLANLGIFVDIFDGRCCLRRSTAPVIQSPIIHSR